MDIKTLDRQKVLEILSGLHGELKNLKVASLFLFGFFAKNQARPDSDIEFLVEFSEPIGLFNIINLKIFLEKLSIIKWMWFLGKGCAKNLKTKY